MLFGIVYAAYHDEFFFCTGHSDIELAHLFARQLTLYSGSGGDMHRHAVLGMTAAHPYPEAYAQPVMDYGEALGVVKIEAFVEIGQEHKGKFKTLGAMYTHESDAVALIDGRGLPLLHHGLGVSYEIEKAAVAASFIFRRKIIKGPEVFCPIPALFHRAEHGRYGIARVEHGYYLRRQSIGHIGGVFIDLGQKLGRSTSVGRGISCESVEK